MTSAQEKKLLNDLIKKLDHHDTGVLGGRFFLPALWVALVIAFTLMFQLLSQELLSRAVLLVVAALIGTFIGWLFFYLMAIKQWPAIQPHIDRGSIEKRLRELET
jgi:hypothetical protein